MAVIVLPNGVTALQVCVKHTAVLKRSVFFCFCAVKITLVILYYRAGNVRSAYCVARNALYSRFVHNVATYLAAGKVAREYGVFTDIANLVVFDVYVEVREFFKIFGIRRNFRGSARRLRSVPGGNAHVFNVFYLVADDIKPVVSAVTVERPRMYAAGYFRRKAHTAVFSIRYAVYIVNV